MEQQQSLSRILQLGVRHWPEAFEDFRSTILMIHRTHSHLDSDLEQLLEQYLLQKADFGVLATLRRSAPPYCLSPTELYRSMLFSSGGLTKVLARIQNAGMIDRVENPEDGRSKLVQLTAQGKATIEAIVEQLHRQEAKKLDVLTEDEKDQLDKLLGKVLGNWEK